MLNAHETEAALKALDHLRAGTPKQRKTYYQEYHAAFAVVENGFREYLAATYAPTLPSAVHDKIFEKAQDTADIYADNSVPTSYYPNIEYAYFELVKFVESVTSLMSPNVDDK
jgi:hypothetical protein